VVQLSLTASTFLLIFRFGLGVPALAQHPVGFLLRRLGCGLGGLHLGGTYAAGCRSMVAWNLAASWSTGSGVVSTASTTMPAAQGEGEEPAAVARSAA
jgi:hypothetical protein